MSDLSSGIVNRVAGLAILFAITFVGIASPAMAQEMRGSGDWRATFDDRNCVVVRDYQRGDDPVHLFIRALPVSNTIYISIREKGFVGKDHSAPATVRLDGHDVEASAYRFELPDDDVRMVRFLIPANLEWLEGIERVELNYGDKDYSFAFDYSSAVAKGLGKCREKINAANDRGGEAAMGDIRGLFSSQDYPAGALMRGSGSVYVAQLTVGTDGRAERCDLVLFAGDPWVPRQTCALLLERARFKPARDADGEPYRSIFITPQIHWMVQGRTDTGELRRHMKVLRNQEQLADSGASLPLEQGESALKEGASPAD